MYVINLAKYSDFISKQVIVHIKVEDINDSPPVFESDCLTFYVPENSPIGTTVGTIHAHDPDEGPNAVVHYSIKGKVALELPEFNCEVYDQISKPNVRELL